MNITNTINYNYNKKTNFIRNYFKLQKNCNILKD